MSDSGYGSALFGYNNRVTSSIQSFCSGLNNILYNANQSGVFGNNNLISGETSFVSGSSNDVERSSSIFITGYDNRIYDSTNSVIEGSNNEIGNSSNTHISGHMCQSGSNNQFVIGKNNVVDNDSAYAFIIGNGKTTSDIKDTGEAYTAEECKTLKSTALEVDWDGNLYISGKYKFINDAPKLDISTDDVHELVSGETYYIGSLYKNLSLNISNAETNGYDNIVIKFYTGSILFDISFVKYDADTSTYIDDPSIHWNISLESEKYYSISLEYDIILNRWIPFVRVTDY